MQPPKFKVGMRVIGLIDFIKDAMGTIEYVEDKAVRVKWDTQRSFYLQRWNQLSSVKVVSHEEEKAAKERELDRIAREAHADKYM